jgi:hypothetical protein
MNFPALLRGGLVVGVAISSIALVSTGCGGEEQKYKPKPGASGKAAGVPAPPTLPQIKKKEGDSFTVAGLVHDMRSKVHRTDVMGKDLSIVGYIVRTNMVACQDDKKAKMEGCVPKCAVHKGGKETPKDCEAPVPTFWIADSKEEKAVMIPVMGWASNFQRIYDAIEEYEKAPNLEKLKEVKVEDPVLGTNVPNPLPNIGGKVKVTGSFDMSYKRATGSLETNPKHGILTVSQIEFLEEPPELANLPGMKERKKKDK